MTITFEIENSGEVTLGTNSDGNYEIFDTTPILVQYPTDADPQVFEPVAPGAAYVIIQAEKDGLGGYTLLVQDTQNGDQYLTWTLNGNGEVIDAFGVVSDVQYLEGFFQADLDADGNLFVTSDDRSDGVGLETSVSDGQYFIDNSATGTQIGISDGGGVVTAATLTSANLVMRQAAADVTQEPDGYKVLLENSVTGDLFVWTLDSVGLVTSIEDITGNSALLASAEDLFGINGLENFSLIDNNTTGVDLAITDIGGDYLLVDGVSEIYVTRPGFGVITDQTYAAQGYVMTQAVADDTADSNGYKLLFQNPDGNLIVWRVDAAGVFISQENITGNPVLIAEAEALFDADLSPSFTPIDDNTTGVDLAITEGGQYLLVDGVSEIYVTRPGFGVITDQTYAAQGYVMTQAAADDTADSNGYKLLFQNPDGNLIVWRVDAAGVFISQENITGNSVLIAAAEALFDTNGLATSFTPIDDNTTGVDLAITADGEYLLVDGVSEIYVTRPGFGVITDQTYVAQGYVMTQAVADDTADSNGYKLLFQNPDGNLIVWRVDAAGVFISQENITGNPVLIAAAEALFDADLSPSFTPIDDNTTGVDLAITADGDYLLVDGVSEIFVTRPGFGVITDQTYAAQGYVMTQAAADDTADSNGYKLLFQNPDGNLIVWRVDAAGVFISQENITGNSVLIAAAEALFDTNGLATSFTPIDDNTTGVDLAITADGEYLLVDGVSEIYVTRPGFGVITDQTYAAQGYVMTQAAADDTADSNGYKLLFQNPDGNLIVWRVDAAGVFISQENITGNPVLIAAAEALFDTNGLAASFTPIDDNTTGVDLAITADGDYLLVDGVSEIFVTRPSFGVITDQTYAAQGYVMTQAAADDTADSNGYKLLFQNPDGNLIVWRVDAAGVFISQENITGNSVLIAAAEALFDTNGLATSFTPIDDNTTGVDLAITADGEYLLVDGVSEIYVTRPGFGVITDQTYVAQGYVMTQAAADDTADSNGYKLLFQNPDGNLIVWRVDAAGVFISQENITGNPVLIAEAEGLFEIDGLDTVEGIGATLIEGDGAVILTEGALGQYFVNDGSGPIGLAIDLTAAETFVWSAVAAEADPAPDPDGYQVLLELTNSEGGVADYRIVTLDDQGAFFADDAGAVLDSQPSIDAAEFLFNFNIDDSFNFA